MKVADTDNTFEQNSVSADLQAQRDYIKMLDDQKFEYGLVLAHTFVNGMRDIGYKSTAYALNELNDNSIQAEARNIDVVFGYDANNPSKKKPDSLAIIDNGHGMDPGMIRASVIWGGTHRHNDRKGFGRYGYGLPSACVSIGRRYTVFSRVEGEQWFKVTVDLDDIADHFRKAQGAVRAEAPVQVDPPEWVQEYISETLPTYSSGTVVLIEKIDRLAHKTSQSLRAELLQDFGVTYRNFLRSVSMKVDGEPVEATDPLFLSEGFRYYDVDDERPEALPPLDIEVTDKEKQESLGFIRVRFAYMGPSFLRAPESKGKAEGRGTKSNPRFNIRKANNGIIVLRQGRQIDVVSAKCPWTTFQNNDKFIGIEVDFPPTLDEDFTITTSKQQIEIKPRIWDILDQHGVYRNIKAMRSRWDKENEALKAKKEDTTEKRPSEEAMESAHGRFAQPTAAQTPEQKEKSEANIDREAQKLAEQTGLPKEQARQILETKTKEQPFKVEYFDSPGAPYYRMEQRGAQSVLLINKAHKFFTHLYAAPFSSSNVRYALEAMLFVMGDCELRANEERQSFYEQERVAWSVNLSTILPALEPSESYRDMVASTTERGDAAELEKERAAPSTGTEG